MFFCLFFVILAFSTPAKGQLFRDESGFSTPTTIEQGYDWVNGKLEREVPTEDIEENMSKIKECINDRINSNSFVTDALQKLVSLETTLGQGKCEESSHKILVANDRGTRGTYWRRRKYLNPEFSRLDTFVDYFLNQHYENCKDILQARLAERLQEMDKRMIGRVEGYVGWCLDEMKYFHYLYEIRPTPDFPTSYAGLFRRSRGDLSPYEALLKLTKGDPNARYLYEVFPDETEPGKMLANEEQIRQLFDRYLVNPCKYYVKKLRDIAELALFDFKAGFIEDEEQVKDGDPAKIEFFRVLGKYAICDVFIRADNSDQINGITNTVVRRSIHKFQSKYDT